MFTTPIYYVNAAPHVGHLYSTILADALARWRKIKGFDVLLTTGTDEHGQKVQEAAKSRGVSPRDYCNDVSERFRALGQLGGILPEARFVRTTEVGHIEAVHELWKRIARRGLIYKGRYESFYCVSDEAFLTEKQVLLLLLV